MVLICNSYPLPWKTVNAQFPELHGFLQKVTWMQQRYSYPAFIAIIKLKTAWDTATSVANTLFWLLFCIFSEKCHTVLNYQHVVPFFCMDFNMTWHDTFWYQCGVTKSVMSQSLYFHLCEWQHLASKKLFIFSYLLFLMQKTLSL